MNLRVRESGFTLIELLVTLTVLGVLLGIAVPSFRDFMATQRVKSAAFDLAAALLLARSEAVKRNADVTVAPATGTDWTTGWTVKAGATTLLQKETIEGVAISSPTTTTSLTFKSTGRVGVDAKFQFEGTSSTVRCVRVDAAGIPSTTNVACS